MPYLYMPYFTTPLIVQVSIISTMTVLAMIVIFKLAHLPRLAKYLTATVMALWAMFWFVRIGTQGH